MDLIENVSILKIKDGQREITTDSIVKELPLTVYLNDEEIATLLCTPSYIRELAVGFLLSEGFINSSKDIKSAIQDEEKMCVWVNTKSKIKLNKNLFSKRVFTSACSQGIIFWKGSDFFIKQDKVKSDITISPDACFLLYKEFNALSSLFKSTGGVHSAALSDGNKILLFREDIGRHNAVDKIFGECILKDISTDDKIMLTSGRISSEIVLKCGRRNVPVIISSSAPTTLSLKIAEELNITTVGFLRGKRLSVFTGKDRIK